MAVSRIDAIATGKRIETLMKARGISVKDVHNVNHPAVLVGYIGVSITTFVIELGIG